MKFTCESTDLARALSTAAQALSTKSTILMLGKALLAAADGKISLACSDGEITIIAEADGQIASEGQAMLAGRLFHEIVKKLPAGTLELSVDGRHSATLKCDGLKTRISGESADLFPRPAKVTGATIEMPQASLKSMIQQTQFALAPDETRRILTGGLIEASSREIRIVCLDGFRMAVRSDAIQAPCDIRAILPARAMQVLCKILSSDESDLVQICLGDRNACFTLGSTTIYTTLIAGEYINYKALIPADWDTRAVIDRAQLDQCISRVWPIAMEKKVRIVEIGIAQGEMSITAVSESGEAKANMEIEQDGADIALHVNIAYLADTVRAIDGKRIDMRLTSSTKPCIVRSHEHTGDTHLILPVRVG